MIEPITVERRDLAAVSLGLVVQRLRDGQPVVPLGDGQAVAQALRLRTAGLSYGAISVVMREYHGHAASGHAWRHRCRNAGAPPKLHGCGAPSQASRWPA